MQFPFKRWSGSLCPGLSPIWLAGLIWLALALDGRAVERQVLHGHVPAAASRLAPIGRLPATQRLHLDVDLPLRNEAALTQLLRNIYDPHSPQYRHYMTPAQFAAEFGPTGADYEAVAAFAKAHNLTVTGRYSNRVIMDLDGTVGDIEAALHVHLRVYPHPTEARTFFAPDAEPSLDLAVPIAHIGGLDNYSIPKPLSRSIPAATAKANGGSGPYGLLDGADFRAAYAPGVSLTGSGQSIALLEFDGYSQSDIQGYESQTGISPIVTCTTVPVDGGINRPGSGQFEVTLDIEAAIAMAPGLSTVIVYEAPSTDGTHNTWHDLLNTIATSNSASQVSCSWYDPGGTMDTVADGIFQQMAMQGQTFFCASGDDDAYTGLISFPQDDPYITLVGGTNLTNQGAGEAWSSETTWNLGNGEGSGGGISTQYSIPSWQRVTSMAANGGSTTMRNTPDVALTATNIYVYSRGAAYEAAGTSCAAPLWAAFTAMVNQEALANGFKTVGFIDPAIYALAEGSDYSSAFHDITTGNNTSSSSPNEFYATTGYDLCTGLGTPAGSTLINALAMPPPDELELSSTSVLSSGKAGGPFASTTGTFTLTNLAPVPLAWTASATQSWLSLSASSGNVAGSGSTTVIASINSNANGLSTGTYSDTISFTNLATGYVQTRPVTLTVIIDPPVITGTLAATATTGALFDYQITATNSPTGYGETGLPSGLSLNTSTGLVSGTAKNTGTSSVSITASNAGGSGTATLLLTVLPPPPVISSTLAATATVGAAFSYHITATNFPTSYGASGLPGGLGINTSSGLISGTAASTGTSNVAITASNAGGTGTASLIITVVPPPPAITSTDSAITVVGMAFSYQITASNSPTSYNATGLPGGFGVNTSTGLISGTATSTGSSNVTLSASNAGGTGTSALLLTILPLPPIVTSTNSGIATQGQLFTYQITATNNPTSYNATGLPGGLGINTSTGVISGTATSTGTTNITITASNLGGTGTASLFLTVLPPPPAITSTNSAMATEGALFTYQITATNNPTSYNAIGLPGGFGVNTSTGLISGTATSTGTSSIAITASNAGGTGTASLLLTVVPPPPVITSTNSAFASQGALFTYQITATNNPTSYSATGLPAGLVVDTSAGLISGTATSSGTSNIALGASNAGGTGTASLFLTVLPPPPVITSTTAVSTVEGAAFSYQIVATNSPAAYSASGLPVGVTLNTSTGLITGTATATGTSDLTVSAINLGGTGTAVVTLAVVTPYAVWQSSYFTAAQLADPTISGDSADPAGDGIPNLLKYALNLNPWMDGSSGLPVGSIVTTGSGNYLTLTYTQVLSATDITYNVQVSSDLQNWNSGPGYTNTPVATGTSNGVTQLYNVQAAQPVDSATNQFIRLQVTGP